MGQGQSIGSVYTKSGAQAKQGVVDLVLSDTVKRELAELFGKDAFVADNKNVLGGNEGCDAYKNAVGGYDDLQSYGDSIYTKAKEKLIRDIAEEVFEALKIQGSKYARSAPMGDVVKELLKITPNPKKGSKFSADFKKNPAKQKEMCHALGNALNKHYGGNIINMQANENEMCQAVSEVMSSLLMGLHTEFMSVAGDVLRVLRNMQSLHQYIDASYKKQRELVDASGDAQLKLQAKNVAEFYERLKGELERQMSVISNLVNVSIGPTGKSLIGLLEDNRDFAGLVKDLKADLGTSAFGDKLAYLLTGVSSVAHSAELVDKALKQLGMSVSEFKSAKDIGDLRLKIFDHIQKKSPSSKELDKLMMAADIIYKNNYSHKDVSEWLSKQGKGEREDNISGGCGCDGGDDSSGGNMHNDDMTGGNDSNDGNDSSTDNDNDDVKGGADDDVDTGLTSYWAKKSLSNKIKKKDKYRKLLLQDFNKLLKSHYRTIVDATNQVARHIGTEIPVSDELDNFIKVFQNLENLDVENLHVALSGWAKDSASKERREQFMNKYILLNNVIEPLTKGPSGQLFKNIQTAVASLIQSIDNFSDKMVKAITEIHVDRPDEIRNALKQTASSFFASDRLGGIEGAGGDSLFGTGSFVEFEKVKTDLGYYLSIANIKTNLSRISEEMQSYGADYEQVLGEEAGYLINNIKKEFLELISKYSKEDADKNNALVELYTRQMNAKVKMVEVAQAVDLYLRAFADGISKHPDSITSVVKMLDQVEIVAKWFNDRSGDNLAAMFEFFPCGYDRVTGVQVYTDGKFDSIDADGKVKLFDGKYNEWLNSAPNMPGNPFLGREVKEEARMNGLLGLSEKTVKSMRALENILSAFKSVGSKFGDLDPMSKTFMNPGQIFNALCDYIAVSAFTTSFAEKFKNLGAAVFKGCVGALVSSDGNTGSGQSTTDKDVEIKLDHDDMELSASLANISNIAKDKGPSLDRIRNGLLSGVAVSADIDGVDVDIKLKNHTAIAMASIPDDNDEKYWQYHNTNERKNQRCNLAGWSDRFYDTDLLFTMTLKAIVCKVFTTVDAYRLFNRPSKAKNDKPYNSLDPLRAILGGDEQSQVIEGGALQPVKVVPEALELYLRLPLLAEWYREKLGFKQGRTDVKDDDWQLSLLPSVDGVWSGLIALIFDKADYVSNGNYTEIHAQRIMAEINDIYKHYKSTYPKATVRNIVNSFVTEVNRVFGFIKQGEIKQYMENRRKYLEGQNYDNKDESKEFNDFDILNAKEQYGKNPAPSDRFVTVAMEQKQRKDRTMVLLQKQVIELRQKMDSDFGKLNRGPKPDFTAILRNYKRELENTSDDKSAYRLVLNMIQGANQLAEQNPHRLIMVHEAVAAPLAVLYNVYTVLAKYNALLHGTSMVNINAWNEERKNGKYGAVLPNKTNGIGNAFKVEYLNFLNSKYLNKDVCNQMVELAVGNVNLMNESYFLQNDIEVGYNAPVPVKSVPIIKSTLEALLELCANPNKLVSCSVSLTGVVNVDWSLLEELCNNLLQQVRSNISKLRTNFAGNDKLLERYELKDNVGSIRWLEENLVEILFKGRDRCGLPQAHAEHLQFTLNTLAGGTETLDNAFRGLIYYQHVEGVNTLPWDHVTNDLNTFPFNVLKPSIDVDLLNEEQKMTLIRARNKQAVVAKEANAVLSVPVIAFEDVNSINKWNLTNNRNKSLMLTFNKMVHQYLYDNLDDGTLKIYTPLFESFMNSAASKEVIQNQAFPNVNNRSTGADAGQYGNPLDRASDKNQSLRSPPDGVILFASTALVMKDLLTNVDMRLKKKKHTYDSLSDIPEYMKERMRCNLPYYSKMFGLVYDKADLLRKLLNNTKLKDNIDSVVEDSKHATENKNQKPGVGSKLKDMSGVDSETNRVYLDGLLSHLSELALSIKKCCDNVYKELQDPAAYFMDMSKDFITDYKQRYGVLPLMPASNVLLPQLAFSGTYVNTEPKTGTFNKREDKKVWKGTEAKSTREQRKNALKELMSKYTEELKEIDKKIIGFDKYLYLDGLIKTLESALGTYAVYKNIHDNNPFADDTTVITVEAAGVEYSADDLKTKLDDIKYVYPDDLENIIKSKLVNAVRITVDRNNMTMADLTDVITTGVIINNVRNTLDELVNGYELNKTPKATLSKNRDDKEFDLKQATIQYNDLVKELSEETKGGADNKQIEWASADERSLLLPTKLNGSNPYKFNYASRLLLARSDIEPQLDHMPGAKEIYNLYATATQRSAQIAPMEYANTIKLLVKLAKFFNDCAFYFIMFDSTPKGVELKGNLDYLSSSVYANISDIFLAFPALVEGPVVFQFINNVQKVLALSDNSNIETSRADLAHVVSAIGKPLESSSREALRTLNILDMNIVPINVHAFMREVPFINILNYSYTFDRMVHQFIIPEYLNKVDAQLIGATSKAENEMEMMVKLLVHPYADIRADCKNADNNYQLVTNLFTKSNHLKLGKPRYLSDQLLGKSLLGNVVKESAYVNPNDKKYAQELGKLRFDTKLVRTLTWIVQLQRIMRVVLVNHLSWLDTPVVKGLKIADPNITEYGGNKSNFDSGDYDGSNNDLL